MPMLLSRFLEIAFGNTAACKFIASEVPATMPRHFAGWPMVAPNHYDCRKGGVGEDAMRWLALIAVLALAGCSSDFEPTAAELKARWDAQNVYPTNYKNDILAFMRTWLNDPEHVRGAAVAPPQLKRVGPGDRFVACLRYDARGGDGKYAGSKTGAAIYISGKLDSFIDTPKAKVQELCQDAAFAAFPELEKLKR